MISKTPNNFKLTQKKVFNIGLFLMLIYFIFHSVYGSRGILAYFSLKSELENSHKTLAILRAERLEIENRTKLLRHESIDKDMLDEKIRNVLGFAAPNEKVFKTNNIEE
jgi:cell division protein FtsB